MFARRFSRIAAPTHVSVLLLLFLCGVSCRRSPITGARAAQVKTRPAAFAGAWYPGNPKELREFVRKHLAEAEKPILSGPVVGLIAPHAGYPFTGPVMGAAYRAIQGENIPEVILIGAPHRVPVTGASVPEAEAFETPLGIVRVDTDARKTLLSRCKFVDKSDTSHAKEHSLEMQLPFLQIALKEFRILPILVGELSPSQSEELAHCLVELLAGKRALIVASTDLSHYPSYEDAKKSDSAILTAATSMNAAKLAEKNDELLDSGISNLDCTMCGLNAVLVLERAAKWMKVTEAKLLCYQNSGDASVGDKSRVVGYGAVAFLASRESGGKWGKLPPLRTEDLGTKTGKAENEPISAEGRKQLLEIARKSVEAAARGESAPDFKVQTQELKRRAGAFVTLKKRGELRGCIGVIKAIMPLWNTVSYAATQAATADPRFTSVTPSEVSDLHLEISVLSPVVPVTDLNDIVVGRDGLIISQGFSSGLLLPQVPVEQKWNREEFLAQTCHKAGLPPDAYKKGASISRFTAQVFGEGGS